MALVSTEDISSNGAGLHEAIVRSISTREDEIVSQQRLSRSAAAVSYTAFDQQIFSLARQIKSLVDRIEVQRSLVALARERISQVAAVAARGFISKSDISQRQETYLTRQQQLSSLEGEIEEKRAALLDAKEKRALSLVAASKEYSALRESGFRARQDSLTAQADKGYALLAPEAGIVSVINVHQGQFVSAGADVLSVVARPLRLLAVLQIPSQTAGRVKAGQDVSIEADAFPVQRYGSLSATIESVSLSPGQTPNTSSDTYYDARINFRAGSLLEYSERAQILPGMRLKARITISKQPLYKWLLFSQR